VGPRLLAAGLALAGLRPPRLVGREDEQRALWAAANGFGARVVWLEGAPGVGASRLAAWVGERLAECGGVALTTDAARGPGGWLAASARLDGASAVEARARLARPGLAPADLDALCALVEGGRSDAAGALARWLSAEFDRPLALIWDDADADPVATAWLRALAASGLSALVVVTAHGPMPPELAGATSLVVGPLPARVRRALVRELVDVEDGVAATLDERTAGNPRFLIELVRTWATGGHLAPGPRGLRLVGDEPPPLPEGDAALGRARVGGLASDDDDERLLVLAALAGPRPDPVVLARAAAEAGLPAPGPLLDRLRAAGVLRGPPSAPTWTHGLVREHLATLRAPERPRLHSALAAALPGGPATDGEVARHLFAAGRAAEAEPLFGAAAAAAGQGVDQGRAEVWCDAWERALDALGAPAEDERRTALLRRRAGVAIDAGRLSAAELLLDEAVAAADQRPSWSLRAELRAQRAVLRERLGRPREALSDCAEAEVLLPTDATGPVRALIELTRAGILANHGQPALARAAADRGLDASPTPFQRAELVCARGRAHLRLGALEESAADFATAAEAYRAAGATRAAASATGEAATVHHVRGDLERAEAGYRAAIEALADAADPSAWNAMVNLAVVLVLQGNDQEASRWTDRVLPRVEAAGYAGPALFARCARWATLEPGPAWDDEADRVEALQARTGVEDGDLAALAERAEHRVSGDRALRAAAFAARRRAGAG
jgi:tetratricopeptide (TPR) repeat protein